MLDILSALLPITNFEVKMSQKCKECEEFLYSEMRDVLITWTVLSFSPITLIYKDLYN